MKKLSGSLANDIKPNKKATSFIQKASSAKETTSRKILIEDYEYLRRYAFHTDSNVTAVLDKIYELMQPVIVEKGLEILDLPEEKTKGDKNTDRNVRISVNFNKYLKELSLDTNYPVKVLLSTIVDLAKETLEKERN